MAVVVIPTRTDLGAYTFQAELDGTLYRFTMQFNEREQVWYLSIADEAGVVIRSGVKIVSNFPLLERIADIRRPPGQLMALSPTTLEPDPGLEALGDGISLVYAEEGEI